MMNPSLVSDMLKSVVLGFFLGVLVAQFAGTWPLAFLYFLGAYSFGGSLLFLAFRFPEVLRG